LIVDLSIERRSFLSNKLISFKESVFSLLAAWAINPEVSKMAEVMINGFSDFKLIEYGGEFRCSPPTQRLQSFFSVFCCAVNDELRNVIRKIKKGILRSVSI